MSKNHSSRSFHIYTSLSCHHCYRLVGSSQRQDGGKKAGAIWNEHAGGTESWQSGCKPSSNKIKEKFAFFPGGKMAVDRGDREAQEMVASILPATFPRRWPHRAVLPSERGILEGQHHADCRGAYQSVWRHSWSSKLAITVPSKQLHCSTRICSPFLTLLDGRLPQGSRELKDESKVFRFQISLPWRLRRQRPLLIGVHIHVDRADAGVSGQDLLAARKPWESPRQYAVRILHGSQEKALENDLI